MLPISEVADRLAIPDLRRSGQEIVGPCPKCGGRDRFAINNARGVWNCRHCGGGDGVALVQHVLACDFRAALAWLVGEADVSIDPAEAARRADDAARRRAEAERVALRKRSDAIDRAHAIWKECLPAAISPVTDYLARRGLPSDIADHPPECLRFHPALPYMISDAQGGFRQVHVGPAMVAACVAPSGKLTGVHRTWIDLDQPKGKARVVVDGEEFPAKKIWGHKKGCAIRLSHAQSRAFDTLVMGEGIETTLTAMAAEALPGAAFWAGIDLGNMAGRRMLRGEGSKYRGIPDLDDHEAFVPPPWVRHLIFIQDGDSDPRLTRAQLLSGLRRARATVTGLRASIVHAGAGQDLNDLLMGDSDE